QSASAPFVRTRNSRASPKRPSHPRLTCRDDRDTSLCIEAGCGKKSTYSDFRKQKSLRKAMAARRPLNRLTKFAFSGTRSCARTDHPAAKSAEIDQLIRPLGARFAPSCSATAGRTMWAESMDELREIHLGLKPKRRAGPRVGERLLGPMRR